MASLIDAAKEFVTDAVASIEKPEASVTDVNVKRVKFGSVTYNAKVNVSNPYSTPIPIGEIRYILKSFGSVIVTGAIPDPGSLKGNGDTMLDVEINVPHSVLISLLKDIVTDWDIDYELQVNLVVDLPVIGEFSIPVTTSGQVKLPTVNNYFTKLEGYPRNVALVVVAGLVVVAVAWWWRPNVKA
uniref:desiccation protectant protein Lea14 homolog n=1 Tax=Erigeron canadensis TaxID=72917 RepID=UPI001CB97BA5|nr:desiccation protectant protein Lea14 homolog [Erigeron canadensis]